MLTPPNTSRVCSKCWKDQPLSEFRTLEVRTGRRSPECRTCRNARNRRKTAKRRRQALRSNATEIRRTENCEKISSLVDTLIGRFGGVESLVFAYVQLVKSPTTPAASRLKLIETILWMGTVAENSKQDLIDDLFSKPEEVIHWLHQQGKLTPVLQRMYRMGLIDLDDIDPPPNFDIG